MHIDYGVYVSAIKPHNALSQAVDAWLHNQLSAETKKAYKYDLGEFIAWGTKQGIESLAEVKPHHGVQYRDWLLSVHSKPTVNRKIAAVRSCFQWLENTDVLPKNPFKFLKTPRPQNASTLALTDAEMDRILTLASASAEDYALLVFLGYLGLRQAECLGIRYSDFIEKRGVIAVRIRGKGDKVREIPITKEVMRARDTYVNSTPPRSRRGRLFKLSSSTLQRRVKYYAEKAGVKKRITPHSFRATCTSHLLDCNANYIDIQNMMGWASPEMVNRYDKRDKLKASPAFKVNYGGKKK